MDNAAFAKIMATPKPHAGGGGGDTEKPMDKAAIRKLVNADLQREKSKKHKGKGGGGGGADAEKRDALNKWEKKKKDKEKKDGKYRDRAEERRTDTNKDYENQVAAIVDMDAETSRYLGGDVEHTHLVKGLDYALLQKVRSEAPPSSTAPPPPRGAPKTTAAPAPATTKTKMAAGVLAFLRRPPPARSATARLRLRTTSLEYDLSRAALMDSGDAPTTVSRSRADRSQLYDDRELGAPLPAPLARAVGEALGRGQAKKKKGKKRAPADAAAAPVSLKAPARSDDIFEDAGADYAPGLATRSGDGDGRSLLKRREASRHARPWSTTTTTAPPRRPRPRPPRGPRRPTTATTTTTSTPRAPEQQQSAVRPAPAGGNRRERRKAKAKTGGVVHRDPIMGTATVAAPKLSRNFDGTDGGYGEATLYDPDDGTYAAMTKKPRRRARPPRHEAAAPGGSGQTDGASSTRVRRQTWASMRSEGTPLAKTTFGSRFSAWISASESRVHRVDTQRNGTSGQRLASSATIAAPLAAQGLMSVANTFVGPSLSGPVARCSSRQISRSRAGLRARRGRHIVDRQRPPAVGRVVRAVADDGLRPFRRA
ncbi:RED-like protein [Aureococcus anophagefferens]|uniref:RED-like protein n=1 Tax=Aureococcus anophagefferens TaxID=44056 RepID=A0ABR1G0M8_AURAN